MDHRFARIASLAGAFALLLTSCGIMGSRKPSLKNTSWVCTKEMFVADAGRGTQTFTLDFTSAKECTYTVAWYLPAHPAMYMNADGTVDTLPAEHSEFVHKGTWVYDKGAVTVTFEDGSTRLFLYIDGKLDGGRYDDGTGLVFDRRGD